MMFREEQNYSEQSINSLQENVWRQEDYIVYGYICMEELLG